MQKSPAALLAELAKEWNRIEGRAKEIESFRGEAIMASINEMRYAGRRVVDFLVATNQEGLSEAQITEHLVVARTYLVNADHDLTDAVIFFVHQRFAAIQKRHGRQKNMQAVSQLCNFISKSYRSAANSPGQQTR